MKATMMLNNGVLIPNPFPFEELLSKRPDKESLYLELDESARSLALLSPSNYSSKYFHKNERKSSFGLK